ncbi:hypothetical protein Z517_07803 [Fonsecaea pedrosoi CBS 271.37]|uniref:Heterokaryon incompatibility domain-containing protein n=1 Tax=Fonsecaea pedrosoi CBS 271.37 TaxID=1442368 RepID=A0A0D2GHE2_9EURO|nr:uncharacterized protein Z517_07803 [Fonsecaea pedrosoi CBS 271.37]KIW77970.1 hypothetical protein Z517_07803 [Fonsecaea pedrosoi CBS 271.37]
MGPLWRMICFPRFLRLRHTPEIHTSPKKESSHDSSVEVVTDNNDASSTLGFSLGETEIGGVGKFNGHQSTTESSSPQSSSNSPDGVYPQDERIVSSPARAYDLFELTPGAVRLVKVSPKAQHESTHCLLSRSTTSSSYIALSYVWGISPGLSTVKLECDEALGRTTESKVRHNLSTFLEVAGSLYPESHFWIDALSIDQTNVDERNHQVQQMGEVYARAEKVLIWLGQGDPALDYTVRAILNEEYPRPQRVTDAHDKFWPGLYKLCTHDYWNRLWIAQEVFLAREISILYGHVEIPWDSVSEIVLGYADSSWFLDSSSDGGSGCMVDQAIRATPAFPFFMSRHVSHGPAHYAFRLHDLLREYGTSRCEDSRDRVFGLLSLTRHGMQFPVDYNQSRSELFYRGWSHFNTDGSPELAYLLMVALELTLEDLEAEIANDPSFHWNPSSWLSCRPSRNPELLNPCVRRPTFDQISGVSGVHQSSSDAECWTCYLCDQTVHLRRPKRDELICCLVRSGFPNHIIFEPTTPFTYLPAVFTVMETQSDDDDDHHHDPHQLKIQKDPPGLSVPLEECRLSMVERPDRIFAKIEMSCPALVFLLRQLEMLARRDATSALREDIFSCVDDRLYRFVLSLTGGESFTSTTKTTLE